MKYIIDTANQVHIDEVRKYGINAITANPTMYQTSETKLSDFLSNNYSEDLDFISFEPKDQNLELMHQQINDMLKHYPKAVVKLNFSKKGLELAHYCQQHQIPTAMSLIFSMNQAVAAINAGVKYLFVFIGRNEAIGLNGLQIIKDIHTMILEQGHETRVVAASLKTQEHLEECAKHGIPYAAIPYDLYIESLHNDLAIKGEQDFLKSNDYLD